MSLGTLTRRFPLVFKVAKIILTVHYYSMFSVAALTKDAALLTFPPSLSVSDIFGGET